MLAANNNNNNMFQSTSSIINESELYQQKRIRAGSISGRLRAASNLEECGIIDKAQKGIIKDLIIGGDPLIQKALDKYEGGDPSDLKELVDKGLFSRHDSIDILCDLDYDFISFNVNKPNIQTNQIPPLPSHSHSNRKNSLLDEDFLNSDHQAFKSRNNSIGDFIVSNNIFNEDYDKEKTNYRNRNFSMDSTSSLKLFDFLSSNNESYIEMSAYEAVARSLQSNNQSNRNANRNINKTIKIENEKIEKVENKITKLSFNSLNNQSSSKRETLSSSSIFNSSNINTFISIPSNVGIPNTNKHSENPENKGIIGAYTIEQRKKRIEKFLEKRNHRVWTKKVKYDVRKNFADSRLRVKGRFVKKEEEHVMRELLDM